jgi:hypothetical protein
VPYAVPNWSATFSPLVRPAAVNGTSWKMSEFWVTAGADADAGGALTAGRAGAAGLTRWLGAAAGAAPLPRETNS